MAQRKDVALSVAAKNEVIVSPLIKQFDPLHPIPVKFQIRWEELMATQHNIQDCWHQLL